MYKKVLLNNQIMLVKSLIFLTPPVSSTPSWPPSTPPSWWSRSGPCQVVLLPPVDLPAAAGVELHAAAVPAAPCSASVLVGGGVPSAPPGSFLSLSPLPLVEVGGTMPCWSWWWLLLTGRFLLPPVRLGKFYIVLISACWILALTRVLDYAIFTYSIVFLYYISCCLMIYTSQV